MESVSHFMAFYCLIEQAAFENTCSNPDFLQLLALAPLECRPHMQHCEYRQNLGSCCEFPNTEKEKKLFHFPNPVKIMELIYIQWEDWFTGSESPKIFYV